MKPLHVPGAPGAITLIAILQLLVSNSAVAATLSSGACQQLARVIEQSVARTLRLERGTPNISASDPSPGVQGCATATATVSRAFTNAMRGMGVELTWSNGHTVDPGDYCLSHDLDQCYPRRSGLSLGYELSNNTVITTAWATVIANVRQVMPFGVRSDIAYFDSTQLAATLSSSLDVTLRTPGWGVQDHAGLDPRRPRSID